MIRVCPWLLVVALFGRTASAQDATPTPVPTQTPAAAPTFVPCQRTEVVYGGRQGFKLSDSKTEAVIVPAIGRVMFYGFVGGPNLLWNGPQDKPINYGWKNWGGDKSWPAPQDLWPSLSGSNWPPEPAWDGPPHGCEFLPHGGVRTTSFVSKASGVRCVREYGFDAQGRFLISQIYEKVRGAPVQMAHWSVTQVPHPRAVYVRLNRKSPYKRDFYLFPSTADKDAAFATTLPQDTLLLGRFTPLTSGSYKIGVDSPLAAIVSIQDDTLFCLRASRPDGTYPDGASGAGLPVELYNHADPRALYQELELLGPLRLYKPGSRFRHTVAWSLSRLPANDNGLSMAAQMLKE